MIVFGMLDSLKSVVSRVSTIVYHALVAVVIHAFPTISDVKGAN